jgi:hypothetical protein
MPESRRHSQNDGMNDLGPVHCPKHGERHPTFVCQHLVQGSGLGFYTPEEESDDQEAWCAECESVRQQQGGWNDVSEKHAGVKLICDACFEACRKRNELRSKSRIVVMTVVGVVAVLTLVVATVLLLGR